MKHSLNNKILFVHQGYELYGSDKVLLMNIKATRAKYPKSKITVVLPQSGALTKELNRYDNLEIIYKRLGIIRKYDFKRFNFAALFRIAFFFRFIRFFNCFDIVYINSIVIFDCILASRYTQSDVFIHVHELPVGFSAKVFSQLLNFSKARLIYISEAVKNAYSGINNQYQSLLWNGVKELDSSVVDETTDKEKIKLLLIGRINKWKGQSLLVDAIGNLSVEVRDKISVRIVGDVYAKQSYLKKRLNNQIEKLGLQKIITIHPFTSKPDLHYNWSDLIVVPSLLPEPFGLVAIEAMSLGKPVIASGNGGLQEIIDNGVNGFLFEPGNDEALAKSIMYVLGNYELISEMGKNAFRTFEEHFSEKVYINKFIKILSEVELHN